MSGRASWPQGGPVWVESIADGAVWRVWLATPKANILDREKSEILTEIFRGAREASGLKAIVLEGEGPNFSYGASVPEHLPDRCEAMLRGFHGLFLEMLETPIPTLAAVRGQCLGGGLELASFCHRVFATPYASMGQPEIVLGVLAPVASVALPERIGRSRAEDLCLSGRSIYGEEALGIGLVDELAEDPGAAALAYATEFLVPRSASSLRMAVRALRIGHADRFRAALRAAEKLYLEELMRTADAVEGITAFVEKREPAWTDA